MLTAWLALSFALSVPHSVQAKKPDDDFPGKAQRQGKHSQLQRPSQAANSGPDRGPDRGRARPPALAAAQAAAQAVAPSSAVHIAIGGYFQQRHIDAARSYYGLPENTGFCPPGLAKKGNGCLPPGQAKKWRPGAPLPAGVVVYDVPRSMVLSLGVPPSGYKYVRVASDILLIAIGTGMVVDAMEDLVR
jgi:Ni/Co efflux regulator RcnB